MMTVIIWSLFLDVHKAGRAFEGLCVCVRLWQLQESGM